MTGKEIRRLRRSLDITQRQLAAMVGVTQANICQIEKDTRIGKVRKQVETILLKAQAQQSQPQDIAA
jgi:predicted transcriptional regulator